jgi:hypothetical protein
VLLALLQLQAGPLINCVRRRPGLSGERGAGRPGRTIMVILVQVQSLALAALLAAMPPSPLLLPLSPTDDTVGVLIK